MRHLWILVVLAFVFGYIAQYLYVSQSPWDKEKLIADFAQEEIEAQEDAINYLEEAIDLGLVTKYINFVNLTLLVVFGGLSLGCVIVFFHMLIDKLFFKKFFQDPDMRTAIRRSGLIIVFLILLIILRLFALLDIYTALIFFGVIVFIEYSLSKGCYNQKV